MSALDPVVQDFQLSSKRKSGFRLENIDIFGSALGFTINGRETFKTYIGALFTLGMVSVLFLVTYSYVQKFLDKENPFILYNEMRKNYNHGVFLTKDGFNFYIDVFNMYTNTMMDTTTFNKNFLLLVTHLSRNKTGGFQAETLPITDCKNLDWPKKLQEGGWKQQLINNGICINKDSVELYQGEKWLQIQLYRCQPNRGVVCENTVPLGAAYIGLYMQYSAIDVTNFDNPMSSNTNQLTYLIPNTDMKNRAEIDVRKMILKTDHGQFSPDFKEETIYVENKTIIKSEKRDNANAVANAA